MTITSSARRAVLGVDAAWTATEPSGVALAVETENGWRLAAAEASYDHFLERSNGADPGGERPRGSIPDAAALLEAAQKLGGRPVDLVAIDMPMARHPIVVRRPCDRKISECYGGRGAATHSPSEKRPGPLSDALRAGFENASYALRTAPISAPPARGLIEVYPHAALIEFLNAPRRLECKAGKIAAYWPNLTPDDRQAKLRAVWSRLVDTLDQRIGGVANALPAPADGVRGWRLKAFEDRLDAAVCAAVAIACLDGKARSYGDDDAAIWVPVGEAG